uniref:Uncharacterized protein n=1 Tax=Panagrolaimus davidi TaxID=227884 RepID=A0A914Q4Y8_9BILA
MNAFSYHKYPADSVHQKDLEKKMSQLVFKNVAIYYYNEVEADDFQFAIQYAFRQKIINEFHADAVQVV